ncbi:MAG: hypothetical protein HQL96_17295 [Magnetococcales bacterium]|nr:hypothetical protein [Magnetococcales bacterium]
MNPSFSPLYGNREARQERLRLWAALVLILLVAVLEMTIGTSLEQENLRKARTLTAGEVPIGPILKDYAGHPLLPAKPPGVKRILYLSNSHAATGGYVARHLDKMLTAIAPGRFEVFDFSSPGIFGPSILQRGLLAMDLEIDLVVLQVAYISFSDRIKLARQDHLSDHFFRRGILERLPAGFWWRNYDIGLFTNHLVDRFLNLTRFRVELRELWAKPLLASLSAFAGSARIRIIEVDAERQMTMPAGFDPTFFDWSLYSLGRAGHMADVRALLDALHRAGIPVIAANLPIDFSKKYTKAVLDSGDFARFRREMRDTLAAALRYTDYQECFPSHFTTYDPLHPTWFGARLHAAHLLLQMAESGWWNQPPDQESLIHAILAQEEAVTQPYRRALTGGDKATNKRLYKRYDPTDPDVAAHLLATLTDPALSMAKRAAIRQQILLRLDYWGAPPAPDPASSCPSSFQGGWSRLVQGEFAKARERLALFRARLADSPIAVDGANPARLDWSMGKP